MADSKYQELKVEENAVDVLLACSLCTVKSWEISVLKSHTCGMRLIVASLSPPQLLLSSKGGHHYLEKLE